METIKHTYKGFDCEVILAEFLDHNRRKVYTIIKTTRGTWMSETEASRELLELEPQAKDYLCEQAIHAYEQKVGHEPIPFKETA